LSSPKTSRIVNAAAIVFKTGSDEILHNP
jgi:hypothetical protein